MAQEPLGRIFNVIPIASGVAVKLTEGASISFLTTAADTFSLTIATSFGGTYRAGSFFTPNWTPVNHYYKVAAATNGTVAWSKISQSAADNFVVAGASTALATVHCTAVPDTYKYIKCTAGGSGLVCAIVHDLYAGRTPANLAILSA